MGNISYLLKNFIKNNKENEQRNIHLDKIIQNLQKHGKQVNKSLQQEILEEIGYSLRKAEEQLSTAIKECNEIIKEFHHSKQKRNDLIKKFKQTKERAQYEKWKYMVQREAIGLVWTEELEKKYSIPEIIEK